MRSEPSALRRCCSRWSRWPSGSSAASCPTAASLATSSRFAWRCSCSLRAILLSFVTFNTTKGPVDQIKAANSGLVLAFALLGICLLAADGIGSVGRLRVLLQRLVLAVALVAVVGIVEYVFRTDIVSPVFKWVPGLATNKAILFAGNRSTFSDIRRVPGPPCTRSSSASRWRWRFRSRRISRSPTASAPAGGDGGRSAPSRSPSRWRSRDRECSRSLVGAFVLLPAWPKAIRRKMLVWSLPAMVAMRFAFPGLLGTITGLFVGFQSDPSYKSRTVDYGQIGTFIAQHPIFGRGFGTFLPKDFFFLDNQYLMSTIDIGFVGLATVIVLLVTGVTLAFPRPTMGAHRREAAARPGARCVTRRWQLGPRYLRLLQLPKGHRNALPAARVRGSDVEASPRDRRARPDTSSRVRREDSRPLASVSGALGRGQARAAKRTGAMRIVVAAEAPTRV